MRSWSLSPPYTRFGAPSWTVAIVRFARAGVLAGVVHAGSRVHDGRATRDRALAEAVDVTDVLDSILSLCLRSIEASAVERGMAMSSRVL